MNEIKQNIYCNFDVFLKSDSVRHVEDAKITCLPELHGNFGLTERRMNAELIENIIKQNPQSKVVVLVESIKSLVQIHQGTHEQTFYCHEKMDVRGWDLGQASEYLPLSKKAKELLMNSEIAGSMWYKSVWDFNISIEQTQNDEEKCLLLQKEAGESGVLFFKQLKEEGCGFDESAAHVFQARNQSMIETIEALYNDYDKIIVLGGVTHFRPLDEEEMELMSLSGCDLKMLEDERFSLEPLHKYLLERSSVILKHKVEDEY